MFVAKSKDEYEEWKKEIEAFINSRKIIKDEITIRINNYNTNPMYNGLEEYKNEMLVEENDFLDKINKQIDRAKDFISKLTYPGKND